MLMIDTFDAFVFVVAFNVVSWIDAILAVVVAVWLM